MDFENALAGKDSLERLGEYWVVARFRDSMGDPGPWSDAVHFTTDDYAVGDDWPFFGSGGCAAGASSPVVILLIIAALALSVKFLIPARRN